MSKQKAVGGFLPGVKKKKGGVFALRRWGSETLILLPHAASTSGSIFFPSTLPRPSGVVVPTQAFSFSSPLPLFTLISSSAMATNSIKLLTGNSHPELANLVADRYASPCSTPDLPPGNCDLSCHYDRSSQRLIVYSILAVSVSS